MAHDPVVFNGRTYRLTGKYFTCHDKWKQTPRRLHRDVWAEANGPIPEGCHIHHVDGDTCNNTLSNLQLLAHGEHLRLHGQNGEWQRSDRNISEVLPAARELSHESRRKPENRKRNSERWHKNEKIQAWIGTEGARAALGKAIEAAKAWHSTPEGKEWHSQNSKKAWAKRERVAAVCTVCGKEYFTFTPTRSKFCHQNCKAKALRGRRAASLQPDGR
jgi:hypothetical protein